MLTFILNTINIWFWLSFLILPFFIFVPDYISRWSLKNEIKIFRKIVSVKLFFKKAISYVTVREYLVFIDNFKINTLAYDN